MTWRSSAAQPTTGSADQPVNKGFLPIPKIEGKDRYTNGNGLTTKGPFTP